MSTVSEMTELQIPFSTVMYRVGRGVLDSEMVQQHLRALLRCRKGIRYDRGYVKAPDRSQITERKARQACGQDIVRLQRLFTRVLKRITKGQIDAGTVRHYLEALAECDNNVWFSPFWVGSPLQQWDALWVMTADRD